MASIHISNPGYKSLYIGGRGAKFCGILSGFMNRISGSGFRVVVCLFMLLCFSDSMLYAEAIPGDTIGELTDTVPVSVAEHAFARLFDGYYYPSAQIDAELPRADIISSSARVAYFLRGGKAANLRSKVAERTLTARLSLPLSVPSRMFGRTEINHPYRISRNIGRESLGIPGWRDSTFALTGISFGIDSRFCEQDKFLRNFFLSYPTAFSYPTDFLAAYRIADDKNVRADLTLLSDSLARPAEPLAHSDEWLSLKLPQRIYWQNSLESTLQLSQNYVSDNWYKGGASSLNIFSREYLRIEYAKDKIRWANEVESKLSIYNASGDSLRRYRVADDVFRIHSNYGYQAFKHWYYTLDAEARTQLFRTYRENSADLQAALFAPLSLDFGLGMKFELKTNSSKVYGRKLAFTLNIAPVSYSLRFSARKDIDLKRHGFPEGKTFHDDFGSGVKAELQYTFNMNLDLQSRLYFATTYRKVLTEWESVLNIAFSRYFSTRVYLYLRYDDSTPRQKGLLGHLQLNELLSIGFNYRW